VKRAALAAAVILVAAAPTPIVTALAPAAASAAAPGGAPAAERAGKPPGALTPVPLGVLPGSQGSGATDVNDRDRVVGWAYVDLPTARTHAWLWSGGHLTDLGSLDGPAGRSFASAVNDRGQVVGTSSSPGGGEVGFLWQNGRMTPLGTPGATLTPTDVDERGRVVGNTGGSRGLRAAVWRDGTLTELPVPDGCASTTAIASNEWGTIAGVCWAANGARHDLLWEQGGRTVRELPTGVQASDVDDRGRLAGRDAATGRATVWRPDGRGGWRAIDLGAATPSEAVDFGLSGEVSVAGGGQRVEALLWRRGVLTALPGGTGYRPDAVNRRGHVVGSSFGSSPLLWR
jgi:probable HAF family extracellular repeat protein